MKKILLALLMLILLPILALWLTGHKYILTALSRTYLSGHKTANIDDYQVFETRLIKAGQTQEWPLHPDYELNSLPKELSQDVEANDGIAFAIVKDGQLLEEQYYQGYGPNSKTNSFSMAKTVLTLMVGKAIEEGIMKNFDQPITDFLPEFKDAKDGDVPSIGSLSKMSSGYEWEEHYYSPFSPTVELLYGDDVESFLLEGAFTSPPDTKFYYSSASTQLLALCLSRALKKSNPKATLSNYLSEKLWKPLGMNDDGIWHLDNAGMELAYCCINTNVRNYARFGQLLLQDGQWNGQQLISKQFVEEMRSPGMVPHYGYSTWIEDVNKPNYYYYRGHLGQYIFIVPEHNAVIVRLGRSRGADEADIEASLDRYVNAAVRSFL